MPNGASAEGGDPFDDDADYWAALELSPKQRKNLTNAGKVLGGTMPAKPRRWDANPHAVYTYSPKDISVPQADAARPADTHPYDGTPQMAELKDVPDPALHHLPSTAIRTMLHPQPE